MLIIIIKAIRFIMNTIIKVNIINQIGIVQTRGSKIIFKKLMVFTFINIINGINFKFIIIIKGVIFKGVNIINQIIIFKIIRFIHVNSAMNHIITIIHLATMATLIRE